MVGLGIDDTYAIERMRPLILHPEYEGDAYEWWLCESQEQGAKNQDKILFSTERNLIFCAADTGTYHLRLDLYSSKLQQSDLQPEGRSTGTADLQGLRPTLSHHFVV